MVILSLRSLATNLVLLALFALSFGCGGGGEQTPTAPPPTAPTPAPAPPPPPPPPPEPEPVQANYRITNAEREEFSFLNADLLHFTLQSRVSAQRIEVSVKLEQGEFDSLCSAQFFSVEAGSQEDAVIYPFSCGADVQWSSVTISPGDSYTCEGCGTFERLDLPRR